MPITASSFHAYYNAFASACFSSCSKVRHTVCSNYSTTAVHSCASYGWLNCPQADRTSTIMVAFMPQRSVSPVRCASTSAESYWAWKHTPLHTPTLYSICNAKSRDLHRLSIFCHFVLFIYHSIKCEIIIRSGRKSNPT